MEKFAEVAEQYAPMVSSIIRKLNIYTDYESFRQLGVIALWQAWERHEPEIGHFAPFAYRSIQGAMKDELGRRQRGGQFVKDAEQILEEEEAAAEWQLEELPEWLEDVSLSVKERRLLQELYVDGYSLTELQKRYGLSLSGMKKRRERTFTKIRLAIPHPYKEGQK
ncbi:sigma-70 family RNA polymerase sigma factor [Planococcus sp. ISL-109]|uniref:sigma-70 family RNA polymerase sigma factor n=1 Tax=Planococcus sp. ISL-109 TaxID=2819166 RepID=UPI001BE91A01|nr:sigma-70 family RNA polymerase sigma factor [Planococcus sp. ISL-109]MBT2581577.1 sigma-70 family RNA polymerase sigma factor [Planococcus sp. ISL-109]